MSSSDSDTVTMCNIRRKAGAEWCGTPRRSDLGSDAEPPGTEAEPLRRPTPVAAPPPKEISPCFSASREARKNQNGFTLIELLIVIVILGVLAGIVVFAVAAFTDRGKSRRVQGRQEVRRGRRRGVPRQEWRLPAALMS